MNEPPINIPIGLGIMANVLRNEGHEVEILDVNAERIENEEVCKRLEKYVSFDIIGIGGLITTYEYIKKLVFEIRKIIPNAKIVLGGGVVTENPTLLLGKTPADIAVFGEGEITIKELAEGKELKNILGICYKENGNIVQNKPRPLIQDLDSLPFPAWDLIPMDIYIKNCSVAGMFNKNTEMNVLSARGCPYNCRYCWHMFGVGSRYRSAENIIAEVNELKKKYNVEFILFSDETFAISKDRVVNFCKKYIESGVGLQWACFSRTNQVDKEMVDIMKKAGCRWVGYGIESGSQKILDNMNKRVTVEQAENAIRLTRNAGIYANTTFMFGYPGETLETIKETLNFCKRNMIKVSPFFTTAYPGTCLYDEIKDKIIEKYGDEESYIARLGDATELTVNMTNFTDEELIRLKKNFEKQLVNNVLLNLPKTLWVFYKELGFDIFSKFLVSRTIRMVSGGKR